MILKIVEFAALSKSCRPPYFVAKWAWLLARPLGLGHQEGRRQAVSARPNYPPFVSRNPQNTSVNVTRGREDQAL